MKCDICNTEQKQINTCVIKFGEKEIDVPIHNIGISTFIKGKHICDSCLHTYHKIYSLMNDVNISCAGNDYYSDGRNL